MMANGSSGIAIFPIAMIPLGEWTRMLPQIMSENMTLELTQHQKDLVLEGLRYIRSSRRFEFREPSQPRDERRENDLRTIAELMGQLDPGTGVPAQAEA